MAPRASRVPAAPPPLGARPYLTHGGAEAREACALGDLQRPVPELRLLPAPVIQVHRPGAIARRPRLGPAGPTAGSCHIGGKAHRQRRRRPPPQSRGAASARRPPPEFLGAWRPRPSARRHPLSRGRAITREPIQMRSGSGTTSLPQRRRRVARSLRARARPRRRRRRPREPSRATGQQGPSAASSRVAQEEERVRARGGAKPAGPAGRAWPRATKPRPASPD